jgi:branched-subunit amino acid ABC-type transport system permease component
MVMQQDTLYFLMVVAFVIVCLGGIGTLFGARYFLFNVFDPRIERKLMSWMEKVDQFIGNQIQKLIDKIRARKAGRK